MIYVSLPLAHAHTVLVAENRQEPGDVTTKKCIRALSLPLSVAPPKGPNPKLSFLRSCFCDLFVYGNAQVSLYLAHCVYCVMQS